MKKQEIFEKFIELIEEYVKEKEKLETAAMETAIIGDLKVNSARLVDIIIKVEDVFDIEIEDDDADKIKTIGDAVDIIEAKLSVTQ
ncbi:MAG: phosphopantetheine-binding protein [Desulfosalsimonadaceae bacterium]